AGADIDLAVNISTVEIEHPHFVTSVNELLERYEFAPARLEFEITESMATQNPKIVLERIAELRRLGIRFAIDDFGTGYSNLSKLVKLPIDTLKLDRSLIKGVATNPETLSVVRVALSLARTFRFRSVVEGVESLDDLKVLAEEGADMAQGFFFSPAVPISEIRAIIQPHRLIEALKPRRPAHASNAAGVARAS
ncbi:MAG: EAL domain-containing protein, partial [Xanthobacteraceae bacterium]